MQKQLTEIQKNILDFLIDQVKGKGMPPTLADVAKHFGYKNRATVQQHFSAIERKGYIKKNPKLSRGIELTLEDKFFVPKPILGEVAAGNPLTIYPDAIDTIELPTKGEKVVATFEMKNGKLLCTHIKLIDRDDLLYVNFSAIDELYNLAEEFLSK